MQSRLLHSLPIGWLTLMGETCYLIELAPELAGACFLVGAHYDAKMMKGFLNGLL